MAPVIEEGIIMWPMIMSLARDVYLGTRPDRSATNGRMTTLGKSGLGQRSRGISLAMIGEEEDYDDEGQANDRETMKRETPTATRRPAVTRAGKERTPGG